MFKNIEQQEHKSFATAISMELSPWSWATTLPSPASTIGFTVIRIDAQIGDTQILSNQLGYVSHGEHLRNGFSAGRYIEV